LQQSVIDQSRADVAAAEANLAFSRQEYARYQALAQSGAGTVQRAQRAAADLRDKTAALEHDRAALDAAVKQMGVLRTQRGKAEATLQRSRAARAHARRKIQ
jgi:membrane fusion protein (multidrug efflux system)